MNSFNLVKIMSRNASLKNKRKYYIRNNLGFSITSLMVATAITAILASVATPNIIEIMNAYKLRMASSDLVSYVNMAKTRAAKSNRQWHIDLDPIGFNGYQIYYENTGGEKVIVASVNFGACKNDSTYAKCYGNIEYKSPDSSSICAEKEFVFSPNGLTNICSATIATQKYDGYYRTAIPRGL